MWNNHLTSLLYTEKIFNFLENQQKCYFITNAQKPLLLITNVSNKKILKLLQLNFKNIGSYQVSINRLIGKKCG